jgi:hypothetical protein
MNALAAVCARVRPHVRWYLRRRGVHAADSVWHARPALAGTGRRAVRADVMKRLSLTPGDQPATSPRHARPARPRPVTRRSRAWSLIVLTVAGSGWVMAAVTIARHP